MWIWRSAEHWSARQTKRRDEQAWKHRAIQDHVTRFREIRERVDLRDAIPWSGVRVRDGLRRVLRPALRGEVHGTAGAAAVRGRLPAFRAAVRNAVQDAARVCHPACDRNRGVRNFAQDGQCPQRGACVRDDLPLDAQDVRCDQSVHCAQAARSDQAVQAFQSCASRAPRHPSGAGQSLRGDARVDLNLAPCRDPSHDRACVRRRSRCQSGSPEGRARTYGPW